MHGFEKIDNIILDKNMAIKTPDLLSSLQEVLQKIGFLNHCPSLKHLLQGTYAYDDANNDKRTKNDVSTSI